MSPYAVPPLIVLGLASYVGFAHLLVYLKQGGSKVHLMASLSALVTIPFDIACVGLYNATSIDEGVRWLQLQFVALLPVCLSLYWFSLEYLGVTDRRIPKKIAIIGAVIVLASFVFPEMVIPNQAAASLKTIDLPIMGEITYLEKPPGVLGVFILVYLFFTLGMGIFLTARLHFVHQNPRAKLLFWGLLFYFAAITNDTLITFSVYHSIYLAEFGFLAVFLTMATTLSQELVDAASIRVRKAHLESELEQAQKLEALGHLATELSKDFSDSLTEILGYSEILRFSFNEEDPRVEDLDQMIIAGEQARGIIRQLKSYNLKRVTTPRRLDLNQLLSDSRLLLESLQTDKFTLQISPSASPCPIMANETEVHRLLLSLTVNAIEAMPSGGHLNLSSERVELEGRSWGRLTAENIARNSPEDDSILHIEPYLSIRSGDNSIGMTEVLRITSLHKARLGIDSVPGEKTTLNILFSIDPKAPSPSVPCSRQTLEGRRFLVVSDQARVRELIVESLSTLGAEATPISKEDYRRKPSRDEAIYDLNDQEKPEDFLERADAPLLFLTTAHVTPDMKRTLSRPFLLEELASALAEAFRSS